MQELVSYLYLIHFMKYLLYFFLCVGILSSSACKDDDDCVPGFLEDVIVGEWNVETFGNVEFQSDGTYLDPDEVLVFNPNNDTMQYTVVSDSEARIIVGPVHYIVQIQEYGCDEIQLSVVGVDYTLTRN